MRLTMQTGLVKCKTKLVWELEVHIFAQASTRKICITCSRRMVEQICKNRIALNFDWARFVDFNIEGVFVGYVQPEECGCTVVKAIQRFIAV
jgi:hypothetical protein